MDVFCDFDVHKTATYRVHIGRILGWEVSRDVAVVIFSSPSGQLAGGRRCIF